MLTHSYGCPPTCIVNLAVEASEAPDLRLVMIGDLTFWRFDSIGSLARPRLGICRTIAGWEGETHETVRPSRSRRDSWLTHPDRGNIVCLAISSCGIAHRRAGCPLDLTGFDQLVVCCAWSDRRQATCAKRLTRRGGL